MKYIVPEEIVYTINDINVIEDEYWSDGTTPLLEWTGNPTIFKNGAEVKVSTDKKKYKYSGVDDSNTVTSPANHPDKWISTPLNPFAIVDASSNSSTENANSIEVDFTANNIDSIHLFNVEAKQIDIDIKHNILTTEQISVGDGVEVAFSYTSTVLPFEGFVEVWIDNTKEAEDIDGDGVLEEVVGNYILSSGTINYETGEVALVFATPPANTLVIQLRYNAKIYSTSKDMTYSDLQSFGDYLFSEQELRTALDARLTTSELDVVVASMSENQINTQFAANPPIYYDIQVYINIQNAGGIAKCGYLVVGRRRDLGVSLYGGTLGLKTASKRDRNSWGRVVFTPGVTYNTMDVPVFIKANQVDVVEHRLQKIMDVPCVFVGDDGDEVKYQSMTIYGFYFDLEAPINPASTKYNLRVESLL